jgi:Flp pilus assembly protein TadD
VSAAADTLQPGQRRVTLADALAEIAAFERENKLAEASDLANRVLNAAPEHPHVLHMAGIVSYRQGRFDEAISRMEKSVRLAPDIALYPRNMCEIYRSTGRLDAALTSGRRAVELSPADSRAHFNLALIPTKGSSWTQQFRWRKRRWNWIRILPKHISKKPKRYCCQANLPRAGRVMNGASS